MIWLAWRQLRTQAVVIGGLLVALAIALVLTGPHLVHLYDTTVATCANPSECNTVETAFMTKERLLQQVNVVMLLMPALIGLFWGAPLVTRELEHRTHQLVWTQSVSRLRWLVLKLVVGLLVAMAVAGILSLMATWWSSPFDRLVAVKLSPSYFDRRGIVPVAYAAFAFSLGATIGILIRRTLPAMAATLVAFILTRYAVIDQIRPRFMASRTFTTFFNPASPGVSTGAGPGRLNPADWILSDDVINRSGRVIGEHGGIGPNGDVGFGATRGGRLTISGVGPCPSKIPTGLLHAGELRQGGPPGPAVSHALGQCARLLDLRQVITYQPGDHFWPIQWCESGLFIALALVVAAFGVWWVRTRLR